MDIAIRHCEIADIPAIMAIYAQPSCFSGTLQLPHPNSTHWKKLITSNDPNQQCLLAELDGQVVGQIGIHANPHPRRKHTANIGMAVHEDFRRRGVADQMLLAILDLADNWLGVHRVELEVYTDNEAAIHLYRRHGFNQEGEGKAYALRDGAYVDVYFMARLK